MPVSYYFDQRIVVMRMEGHYSHDEVREGLLTAFADPACPPDSVLMFDIRTSEAIARRTPPDIRGMAFFLAAHAEKFHRRLGLVAEDDLAYGLLRLGAAHAQFRGLTAEVFRDWDSARQWLLECALPSA